LIIATGRPYKSIRQHIETKYENLKPDYYICNAGATINDHNGEVLYYSKFDKLQQDLITKKLIEIQNEITAVIYATPTEEEMLFDKE
jgi:hydroxymethylpyrimidine pyrophosphatase-like HAD family hydrolase